MDHPGVQTRCPPERRRADRDVMMRPGADLLLDSHEPPCASYLLHPRVVPDAVRTNASLYIHATDRSCYLFIEVMQGHRSRFLLCNTDDATATRLRPVPSADLAFLPHRSIGLMADPRRRNHHMVAQLQPGTGGLQAHLICFSTMNLQRTVVPLTPTPGTVRVPDADHGVFAHGDHLCWVSLGDGLYYSDPFAEVPRLRFVRLPADHQEMRLPAALRS